MVGGDVISTPRTPSRFDAPNISFGSRAVPRRDTLILGRPSLDASPSVPATTISERSRNALWIFGSAIPVLPLGCLSGDTGNMRDQLELLKLDYEQTLQTYRQLAEIRFKLLAFVPTISGAAIALLTKATMERWEKVVLAGLGFLVTLGVILYDQRNTQFYNGAIGRAQHLEEELGLLAFEKDKNVGLFGSRMDHTKHYLFGLPVGHDLGLALIYSPVLGAWVYAAIRGGWPTHQIVAAVVGVVVAVLALIQFEWHNGKPERLNKAWRQSQETRRTQRKTRGVLRS
jgi:hypothetical protein